MNIYEVTGMKPRVFDFVNKESGEKVHNEGVDYYISCVADSKDKSKGMITVKSYVSNERITRDFSNGAPILGDRVIAYLNKWDKYYIVGFAPAGSK